MAATLVIDIITNTSKAQAGLTATSSKTATMGGRIKSTMKSVGGAIAGAFAVEKVVDFAKQSIGAASDLAETMSKTQQIFGKSSDAVVAWSKDSSNALGMSQQEALDSAATFATFGKSAGKTGGDLVGFSTKLTGLAADMASFSNTTPDEAAEALGAALRGESEPIRKYGVLLDDATLRARALKMGLIKTTKDALTPQQKVLAAQKEIFAQTKDAQGDFARTSGGLANQQRILSAKMANVKATLGTALLPIVLQAVTAFQSLAHWGSENKAWLVPLASVILAVAAAWKLWNIALAVTEAISKASTLGLIVVAIAAIVAAIIVLEKKFGVFSKTFRAVFAAVKAIVGGAVDFIRKHWKLILGILTGPIGAAVLLIIKYKDKIIKAFTGAFSWIKTHWPLLLAIITGPIGLAVLAIVKNKDKIIDLFKAIPAAIRAALSGLAAIIKAPFETAWHFIRDRILDPLKSGFQTAFDWVADIWNTFARGWNAIEIKLPEVKIPPFGPTVGGGTIGLPDLPMLAAGGYVRRATLAVVGERGGEIVAPEPMLRQIIRDEIGKSPTVVVNGALDPDAVARQITGLLRKRAQRVGGINQRGQVGVLQ